MLCGFASKFGHSKRGLTGRRQGAPLKDIGATPVADHVASVFRFDECRLSHRGAARECMGPMPAELKPLPVYNAKGSPQAALTTTLKTYDTLWSWAAEQELSHVGTYKQGQMIVYRSAPRFAAVGCKLNARLRCHGVRSVQDAKL
jgi:hypothetical protein